MDGVFNRTIAIASTPGPNLTAIAIEQGHDPIIHRDRIVFFEFKFKHVQDALTFALWFLAFHRFERFKGALPDSALLLFLGLVFGGILHYIFPDKEIYLQPDWFFLYLLPPIVLEAGYFLPNREFFQNIGTITTYAVVGTIWNVAATGASLYFFRQNYGIFTSTTDILLFATLISAVDPVAVICVFEEIHVNQLLYICVFAIAEVGPDKVFLADYFIAVFAFFCVSFGGIIIGAIWAVFTGFVTKWGTGVSVVQPLTCLLFPYLAYIIAEMVGLSGILACVTCGLMMKHYVIGNISEQSKITVNFFMKTLSSSCEAVIFVFLGVSAVSKSHYFDMPFIIVTLVSIFLFRFIGVGILTWIMNLKRMQKINIVDQFIMGYGGIRGAVCYGLVMSLSPEMVLSRNMFATTTIIVIFFTVFVQGGTIKKVVKYLKVKQQVEHNKTVFEMITDNVNGHITGGIESIIGHRGNYWLRMLIQRFNDKYIQPFIMVKPENHAMKILRHNEEIQVTEALTYLKQHGSFAGMPTVQSRTNLYTEIQMPPQMIMNGGTPSKSLHVPVQRDRSSTLKSRSMSRNESISRFVADAFAELNSSTRGTSHQRYSRHFMPTDLPMIFLEDGSGGEMSELNYKTYPYSKSSQKDLMILAMRKVSRSSSGPATGSAYQTAESSPQNNGQPIEDTTSRPTFIISESDFDDGDHAHDTATTSFAITPTPKYSIGRFEVNDGATCNGNNGGSGTGGHPLVHFIRRPTCSNGNPEESMPILMPPIEEQDEDSSTLSPRSNKHS